MGNVGENNFEALSFTVRTQEVLQMFQPLASAVAQLSCTDDECVSDCTNSQWNINQCYNTTGGNSQIFLSCDDGGVKGIDYTGPDCTGQGTSGSMDVAKCLISETNTSFINTCVTTNVGENNFEALSFTVRKQKVLQMFQPLAATASGISTSATTQQEAIARSSSVVMMAGSLILTTQVLAAQGKVHLAAWMLRSA